MPRPGHSRGADKAHRRRGPAAGEDRESGGVFAAGTDARRMDGDGGGALKAAEGWDAAGAAGGGVHRSGFPVLPALTAGSRDPHRGLARAPEMRPRPLCRRSRNDTSGPRLSRYRDARQVPTRPAIDGDRRARFRWRGLPDGQGGWPDPPSGGAPTCGGPRKSLEFRLFPPAWAVFASPATPNNDRGIRSCTQYWSPAVSNTA